MTETTSRDPSEMMMAAVDAALGSDRGGWDPLGTLAGGGQVSQASVAARAGGAPAGGLYLCGWQRVCCRTVLLQELCSALHASAPALLPHQHLSFLPPPWHHHPHTVTRPPHPLLPPLQALLEYKLVLMNKQDEVMVGLAHVPARRYSQGIKITTWVSWGQAGGCMGGGEAASRAARRWWGRPCCRAGEARRQQRGCCWLRLVQRTEILIFAPR